MSSPPSSPRRAESPPPPARPVEVYRGAELVLELPVMGIVGIRLPGTVLHGHSLRRDTARGLVDWWLDTGGDQSRLPKPYKAIHARP